MLLNENQQAFMLFMAKWAAAEEIENVNDKIQVNTMLSMELELLQM